jgi:hypothetical protein
MLQTPALDKIGPSPWLTTFAAAVLMVGSFTAVPARSGEINFTPVALHNSDAPVIEKLKRIKEGPTHAQTRCPPVNGALCARTGGQYCCYFNEIDAYGCCQDVNHCCGRGCCSN